MIDILISVGLAICAALSAILGWRVTLHPPQSKRCEILYTVIFVALAVVAVVFIFVQGVRQKSSQDAFQQDIRAADGNVSSLRGEIGTANARREQAEKDLAIIMQKIGDQLLNQMSKTESVLRSDINAYQNAAETAVEKVLRPPRTLGPKYDSLVQELRKCGAHEVAITMARGNAEALDFANEVEQAFKDAGWTIAKTQFPFITKDAYGLRLVIKSKDESTLTPEQRCAALAFKSVDMQLTGQFAPDMKEGPVELYIGLQ